MLFAVSRLFANAEVPDNPAMAYEMLQNGLIDSVEWKKIEPYYYMPLNVPSGEIKKLKEIYPLSISADSYNDSVLQMFYPWGEDEIIRFFNEFPELTDFLPVLDFTMLPLFLNGRFIVSEKKVAHSNTANTSLRMKLKPFKSVSIDGLARLTDNDLKWYNRMVEVSFPAGINIQIGNIDAVDDNGVFFGLFPDSLWKSDSCAANKWLYGSRHDWNGISFVLNHKSNNKTAFRNISVTLHKQPSEAIGNIFTEMQIYKYHILSGGVAGIEYGGRKPVYAYLKYQCDYRFWNFDIISGTGLSSSSGFPVCLQIRHTGKLWELSCNVSHYPESSGYDFSRICSNLVNALDDSTGKAVSGIRVEKKIECSSGLQIADGIELNCADYHLKIMNVYAKIGHSGSLIKWWIRIRKKLMAESINPFYLNGAATVSFSRNYSMTISLNSEMQGDRLNVNRLRMTTDISMLNRRIRCEPFAEIKKRRTQLSVYAGFIINFSFFNGTSSSIEFDSPLSNDITWTDSNLECKGIFTF